MLWAHARQSGCKLVAVTRNGFVFVDRLVKTLYMYCLYAPCPTVKDCASYKDTESNFNVASCKTKTVGYATPVVATGRVDETYEFRALARICRGYTWMPA